MTTKIETISLISEICGIVTLFAAILTYWINTYKKNKNDKKTRAYLNIEIRTLYFDVLIPNIISYDKLFEEKYSSNFNGLILNHLVIDQVVSGNIDILRNFESPIILKRILFLIKSTEDLFQKFTSLESRENKKTFYDFYFKQMVEIRQSIIELSENERFIDLNVMPKKIFGIQYLKDHQIQKYKDIQKNNQIANSIIQKHLRGFTFRDIPHQYFGE